jgi:hypothetical protein
MRSYFSQAVLLGILAIIVLAVAIAGMLVIDVLL